MPRSSTVQRSSARAPSPTETPAAPWIAAALICGAGVVLLGVLLGYTEIDVWGALILPLLLFAVLAPCVAAIEGRNATPLVGLAVGGLAARLIGAWLRYLVSFHVYDVADAAEYHRSGSEIARRFARGELSLGDLIPRGTSIRFVNGLTGLVESVIGPSLLGSYMVFTVLSYLGSLLMLHAARSAIPRLMARRYAALVLFLPSMLYWPSALGKDGPMQLGIGLAAFGASRLLDGRTSGWLWTAAGIYLAGSIRPHVAVLLVAATGLAFIAGSPARVSDLGPVSKLIGIAALVVALTAALSSLGNTLGGFSYSDPMNSATSILNNTQQLTSTGGSEIETVRPNNPLAYPRAAFTVLFRPLLTEADSLATAASALEGTVLLYLVWRWRRNIAGGIALLRTNRYLRFVVMYSVTFCLAWSSVNNLAIIARQRVMMLPLLAVLFCIVPDTARSGQRA